MSKQELGKDNFKMSAYEISDEELEQITGGGLGVSGSLNLNGTTVNNLTDLPAGTDFYCYFDGEYRHMRRNDKYGFDGVTDLESRVYYPRISASENHTIQFVSLG